MHGMGNQLQGEGVKCMERGTIFRGGGDHEQRKIVPSSVGETICEGQEPIFREREPFQSSVFLQSTKCCQAVQTGIRLNRSRNSH
jgi:hypothetical protein